MAVNAKSTLRVTTFGDDFFTKREHLFCEKRLPLVEGSVTIVQEIHMDDGDGSVTVGFSNGANIVAWSSDNADVFLQVINLITGAVVHYPGYDHEGTGGFVYSKEGLFVNSTRAANGAGGSVQVILAKVAGVGTASSVKLVVVDGGAE